MRPNNPLTKNQLLFGNKTDIEKRWSRILRKIQLLRGSPFRREYLGLHAIDYKAFYPDAGFSIAELRLRLIFLLKEIILSRHWT